MGKEAMVEAHWPDGGRDVGRLRYEPPKLIFRGAERRVFAGAALAGVVAEGRELVLADGARFVLPTPAQSWADAIARPKGRLEKLGVKPALRIGLLGVDDPVFAAELAAADAPPCDANAEFDLLFYAADSAEALTRVGDLARCLAPKGALWIVSLKGRAAGVKDVEVMAAAKAHGLADTKVCAVTDTHTALKFVRRRA